jgi:hypothetical protein
LIKVAGASRVKHVIRLGIILVGQYAMVRNFYGYRHCLVGDMEGYRSVASGPEQSLGLVYLPLHL